MQVERSQPFGFSVVEFAVAMGISMAIILVATQSVVNVQTEKSRQIASSTKDRTHYELLHQAEDIGYVRYLIDHSPNKTMIYDCIENRGAGCTTLVENSVTLDLNSNDQATAQASKLILNGVCSSSSSCEVIKLTLTTMPPPGDFYGRTLTNEVQIPSFLLSSNPNLSRRLKFNCIGTVTKVDYTTGEVSCEPLLGTFSCTNDANVADGILNGVGNVNNNKTCVTPPSFDRDCSNLANGQGGLTGYTLSRKANLSEVCGPRYEPQTPAGDEAAFTSQYLSQGSPTPGRLEYDTGCTTTPVAPATTGDPIYTCVPNDCSYWAQCVGGTAKIHLYCRCHYDMNVTFCAEDGTQPYDFIEGGYTIPAGGTHWCQ